MKVSLSWLGTILLGITIVYFIVYGNHVYETFKNESVTESFANPIQLTDLQTTKCPAGSISFIDKHGMTLCCDGNMHDNKCNGSIICTLSENTTKVPTCNAWKEAYLKEKGIKRCPKSLPKYFESNDGHTSGCTSGKRNKEGTDAINNSKNDSSWCAIYNDKENDEGNLRSCSNIKMTEKAVCFPKSGHTGVSKKLIEQRNADGGLLPATIECKQAGQIHTCMEDKSLLRFMKSTGAKNNDGTLIQSLGDVDSQDNFYSCSNFEQMHIMRNISWDDVRTNNGTIQATQTLTESINNAKNVFTNSPKSSATIQALLQLFQNR